MFCRCRSLQAFHLESLLPAALPSIPTRCTSRTKPIPRSFYQSFTNSPPSHHERTLHGEDGDALDISGLVGSSRSPLAFKPLPSVTRGTPFPGEGEDLGLDGEERCPPVMFHDEDPLFPPSRPIISPEDAEDSKESPIVDSKPAGKRHILSWRQEVRRRNTEKFRRQVAEAKGFLNPTEAIQQWNYIRTWERFRIANLSIIQWTLLARAGCMLNAPSVLYHLPAELVDAHASSPRAQLTMVSKQLQRLVPARLPMFDPLLRPWDSNPITISKADAMFHENLDRLLIGLFSEYYQNEPILAAELPHDIILRLAAIAAYSCPRALNHGGLLNISLTIARKSSRKLHLAFPSRDPAPLHKAPTGHIWAFFRLVQVYINSGSLQDAFRLFQRLVQQKMFTSSAISQANINPEDPRPVVLFTMTRTCLDYGWNTGALELMVLAADHDPTIFNERMGLLVNETLYVLLEQAASMSPAIKYNVRMSAADQRKSAQQALPGPRFLLQRIIALVAALRRNNQIFELEDRVVQNFYTIARRVDFHPVAEALFRIGRIYTSPSISEPSMLVSPSFEFSDDPLSKYLLPIVPRQSTFKSTSRSIPASNEPHSTIASEGSLELPTTGNTRYPPPYGLPLLWLLDAMLKKSKNVHLCRCLAEEVVESNIDIPIYDRGKFIQLLAQAGLARAAKELWERYSQNETQGVIGHAGAMLRLVSLFYRLGRDLETKEATIGDGSDSSFPDPNGFLEDDGDVEMAVIGEEDAKVLFDADAAKGFAKEVAKKFRDCKEPIQAASQYDFNALARAYFMMDRPDDGFALFQTAKGTFSPDMHDVNVVLLGVAKYNVALAASMVDRMHERGLVPDPVAWGTLIHFAFLKGDVESMIGLVERAHQRGISEFSSRTTGSLIRASLSDVPSGSQVPGRTITLGRESGVGSLQLTFGGEGSVEQVRRNLGMALRLIRRLDTEVFVGIWSLAKFCLDTALRVGDAELAFSFWDKYLRSKTQWKDAEQISIRKKLYKLIAMAKEEKELEAAEATKMLRKLSGSRRRASP